MKIGVVSDTHSLEVPSQVIDDFKDVDFIVHAGDFCSLNDLETFSKIKEVKGVFGNMDNLDIRAKFPQSQIFALGDFQIGLCHGNGSQGHAFDNAREEFKGDRVDAVIFGHSHKPFKEVIDGVLYFNPGSPNDCVRAPYCSYGMIEVKSGKLCGQIIKVK